ncbi:MAG: MFS transporter [Verrucomicrobiota bacterium]|nr:MFS transporter [Verrucomicrobiales bacterium]MEC7882951.1 MFS transporter [Verrucomicrobiota bacterium]MED5452970.1 MFS transporter [Verrucomicrobiota bacterium]
MSDISSQNTSSGFWGVRTPFAPSRCPIFYGWIIVFAATIGSIFSIPGQTMGFSVFTDVLIKELGLTRVELSLAYCLGTVASGLTLPWLGRLLDRWGERRMAVASVIMTGLVLFYLSKCGIISQVLGQLMPTGIAAFVVISLGFYLIRAAAQGVLSMTCRNAIGKWFNYRRGLALAISGILVSFCYSFAPRGLDWLIKLYGYDGAWFVMGVSTIVIMAPLAWLLFRDAPEQDGLEMDGGKVVLKESSNPDMHIHREFTRREALRDYSFWVFNLTFSFYGLFATAFTFHILSLAAEYQFADERILSLFVPIAAMSVVTNLIFGAINARLRLKWLLLVMNLGCLSATLGMLCLDKPAGVPAYVIGNGIASGGFVSLTGIVFPRFYGRLHLGAISGVNMSAMVIASGLGPLAFGLCHHISGSYRWILIASVFVPTLLALMSLKADNPQRKLNVI